MIYLDHAASTPLLPEALTVLTQASEKAFANPAAQHRLGRALAEKIERVRALFLEELEASDYELVFTSSATEANNLLISGLELNSADNVYFSKGDHPSLARPMESHFEAKAYKRNADATPNFSFLSENARLAVFAHVNNFSGSRFDLGCVPESSCHVHVDASQSFAKSKISLKNSNVDSLTLSAHKMGGPKGIAALVFRKGLKLKPFLLGGGHESGLRASTPATPLVMSWAAALQKTVEIRDGKMAELQSLNLKLRESLKADFPFTADSTCPSILCLTTSGIPSDVLLRHLEEYDIIASSSSACSSKQKAFDPAYADLGIPETLHKNILRISMGWSTESKEIEFFIEKFNTLIESLKKS